MIPDIAARVREVNRKAIGLSLLNVILWLVVLLGFVVFQHWGH